ncbi:MAG: hypothetical protein HN368_07400, partial [Spirochaetales bacterium]|nr:hypothetical protein [Spirochaetales bacterium]
TAGGYRIAVLAVSLFGEMPAAVRCTFDPDGSYAPTYIPLGVDKAFCAGVIGMDMLDPRYDKAIEIAAESVSIDFLVAPLEYAEHPNTARIELAGTDGKTRLTVWARSTGGGVVEIFRIDETALEISGKYLDAFVQLGDKAPLDKFLGFVNKDPAFQLIGEINSSVDRFIQIRILTNAREDAMWLKARDEIEEIRIADPVFFLRKGDPLFESAEQMAEYSRSAGLTLGEAGLAYESGLLGISQEEASREMYARYEVMRGSVEEGLDGKSAKLAWLKPHAAGIARANSEGRLPFGGTHTKAAARALAVMHTCNSRGIVCAAPTGGSAGVLPGVLMTLEEELGLDRKALVAAAFAAGAVGLIMAKRATFAAESAGCQVEIGIAGAMAAAAAVEAVGGTANDALDAAAVALQNTMGSVCDPVGGGCEIPCHSRNALAAAAAFTNADLVLGGYPNPIPLDEMIDASYQVGRMLPSELRCTARGGIAVTPSAQALVAENPIS